jgi:hypothetical protein
LELDVRAAVTLGKERRNASKASRLSKLERLEREKKRQEELALTKADNAEGN